MTEDVKPVPDNFYDPKDKLVLSEVPTIDVSDLEHLPVSPLSKEEYRNAVIAVDQDFVALHIDLIAQACGVDVIDDLFYDKEIPTTDKASSLFVIRNRRTVKYNTDKGIAEWEGIQILVKNFVVAGAQVRSYAHGHHGVFMYVRLYDKRIEDYVYQGDSEGKRPLKPESVPRLIINFLEQEGILNPLIYSV